MVYVYHIYKPLQQENGSTSSRFLMARNFCCSTQMDDDTQRHNSTDSRERAEREAADTLLLLMNTHSPKQAAEQAGSR
jgi:hypothetical protein